MSTGSASLSRRMAAEGLGTALLVAAVVGSGIMGERLAGGNVALALIANTLATGAALLALILTFGPVSGAHFNPAVTLADASRRGLSWRDVLPYVAAQLAGAVLGTAMADVMFGEPIFAWSRHPRSGLEKSPATRGHSTDGWRRNGRKTKHSNQGDRLGSHGVHASRRPKSRPRRSQSTHSSDETSNDRGAKGVQEDGRKLDRTTDDKPLRVPARAVPQRT